MANKKMKKNLKLVNTAINNTQNKEEKNMKTKNTEITGATMVLTKKCVGTVTFTQPVEHGPIIMTFYKNHTKEFANKDEAMIEIKKFLDDKWEKKEIVEHKVAAPTNYSAEYKKNLEKINSKSDRKVTAPENPDKDEKKPTTYAEAIEQKYGSKEERTAKMIRKNELWREMSSVIRAEVQKSGKYLRKDAWKTEMYNRLEKNPEWVQIVGLRKDSKKA